MMGVQLGLLPAKAPIKIEQPLSSAGEGSGKECIDRMINVPPEYGDIAHDNCFHCGEGHRCGDALAAGFRLRLH